MDNLGNMPRLFYCATKKTPTKNCRCSCVYYLLKFIINMKLFLSGAFDHCYIEVLRGVFSFSHAIGVLEGIGGIL